MKSIKLLPFLILTFLTQYIPDAAASHAKGADLTYQYVGVDGSGNYQYKVSVNFYRDCAGANGTGGCNYTFGSNCNISGPSCNSSSPMYFYLLSASCGICMKDSFNVADLDSTYSLPSYCGNTFTTCSGGSYPGVQILQYSKLVTLPQQCVDWRFVYGS